MTEEEPGLYASECSDYLNAIVHFRGYEHCFGLFDLGLWVFVTAFASQLNLERKKTSEGGRHTSLETRGKVSGQGFVYLITPRRGRRTSVAPS